MSAKHHIHQGFDSLIISHVVHGYVLGTSRGALGSQDLDIKVHRGQDGLRILKAKMPDDQYDIRILVLPQL